MENPEKSDDEVRKTVRQAYSKTMKGNPCCGGSSCSSPSGGCCGSASFSLADVAENLGYTAEELQSLPKGANLGLGCGSPLSIAHLKAGETVLDLGSGAGIDCFLAAIKVGAEGFVIGVDMTPEMISKSREIAASDDRYANVDFRLGEIEHLPVADQSVDVVLSNCVVNLSPDKASVFQEAYRVLKPNGRLAIYDMVATAPMPDNIRNDPTLYTCCIAGAADISKLYKWLETAGFENIRIVPKEESLSYIKSWKPEGHLEDYVISATIEAEKPLD